MTGLLGGGSNAKQQNIAASLRFQSSQKGSVIPLVYGTNRLAINLLDYQNFNSHGGTGKGKGGGSSKAQGKSGSQTMYQVDFVAGVCQGPIANWGLLWYNKTVTTLLGGTGISFSAVGADGQATDSYWTANYPNNAINYSGTAFFTGDQYQLGSSPALPNFNVEVEGLEAGSAPNGCDANPGAIVADLLTNPRYGAEFPAAALGDLGDYEAYCNAAGVMLAPVYNSQQSASQMLAELAAVSNSAVVWSGGTLKIIPYGDEPLSATFTRISMTGAMAEGDLFTLTFSGGGLGSPVTVSHFLTQNDVISYSSAWAGIAATITGNGTVADPGNGTLATAGIYASVAKDALYIVQTQGTNVAISAGVSNGGAEAITVGAPSGPYAWTPNTTPLYSLGEDDYIVQQSSVGAYLGVTPGGPALRLGAGPITGGFTDDPVHVTRSTPADAMNMVQLETTDRGTSYNTSVVEAFDQGSIDLYGIRRDTSLKARAIVDAYYVGTIVAQLVLQRQLLYRNSYTFRLGWKYILLEPMDLVQITDERLGLAALTVRVTAIEEDDEGTLSVTCEDWFGVAGSVAYPPPAPVATFSGGVAMLGSGGGTAMPYPKQSGASEASAPNYGQAAPSVNPPFIFEPTAQLLAAQGQTSPYVGIGLSGGPNRAYSANWGGADIYVSLDGSSFALFGEFAGRSTMGYTTADCPAAGTSLAVDLGESAGQLNSVSAQLAASGVSLCAVRTPAGLLEFLSFTTAALTGPNQYTLTGLFRGLYGTFAIDLPPGSQFLSLGKGGFFLEVLPAQFVGQNLFFEFPSFNLVGGGEESLAETTIYEYTPRGASVVPGLFPTMIRSDEPTPAEVASGTTRRDSILPAETRGNIASQTKDSLVQIEARRRQGHDDRLGAEAEVNIKRDSYDPTESR